MQMPCRVFLLFLLFVNQPICFADSCVEANQLLKKGVELGDGSSEEIELYKQALEKCPKLAEANYNLGLAALKKEEYKEAQTYLEEALKQERKEDFILALAEVQVKTDDTDKARQLYAEVLEKSPQNVKALQGMAILYEKMDKTDDAVEYLEKALKEAPDDPVTHLNLAVIYEKQNKLHEALNEYKRAGELDENNYHAWLYAGLLNNHLEQYEEARNCLLNAVKLKSEDKVLHQALGSVYDKLGDNDKAELEFSKAIALDASDLDSKINLAITKIRKKREAQAEEILKETIQVLQEPKQKARAYGVLGWAQLELGKYQEAEKSLLESLKIDEKVPSIHYNLGILYERMGKKEEAKEHFKKADDLKKGLDALLK